MTASTISNAWLRREDIFTNHHLVTLMNYKAVCGTAPATLGLLISQHTFVWLKL